MNRCSFMGLPGKQKGVRADVAILGIPFSPFNPGCRHAPSAVRMVSAGLRSNNPGHKANVLRGLTAIDCGDIPVLPNLIHETYDEITQAMKPLLDDKTVPICIGGDHSVTLGEIRAMSNRYGKISVVHMDAHGDVYDSYNEGRDRYNAGTFLKRALEEGLIATEHSITVGLRSFRDVDDDPEQLGLSVLDIDTVLNNPLGDTIKKIHERVGNRPVFLSFDIDVVDPAYAPGTNSQIPGGLTSREALTIIRGLKGLSFVGFDVVEIDPYLDPSQTTARLATHIMYEFMTLVAFNQ